MKSKADIKVANAIKSTSFDEKLNFMFHAELEQVLIF